MFFLVAIITIVNAIAHNMGIVLEFRVNIQGTPINIFDGLLLFALVASFFRNRGSEGYINANVHPALWWIEGAFALALCGGLLASMGSAALTRDIVAPVRNLLSLPISIYVGYCALGNLRGNRRFVYVMLLAGVLVSFMILAFFSSALEHSAGKENIDINTTRAVAYVSNYAGLACALLYFSMICGIRIMPVPLALIIGGFCMIGQFATLSRSDWLATLAGVFAICFLLPSINRGRKIFAGMLIAVMMFFSLWGGLYFASRVSGRDFYENMVNRAWTLVPGEHGDNKNKAWDTRLSGAFVELQLWSTSPLYGRGFGTQATMARAGARESFGHNTWTSTLAETGLLGFTAMCLVVFSMMVVGRRMVRDRIDAGSVLLGALGVIAGFYYIVLGLTTMSFNQMRWAIPMGMICGAVLRSRAMQLVTAQTYAGYLEPNPDGTQVLLDTDGESVAAYDPAHAFGGYAPPRPGGYDDPRHAEAYPN